MREGNFVYKDNKGVERVFQPNNRIATALNVEANLGLRIGDVVKLRISDMVKDGTRYRLDIIEEKTRKKREFTVPVEVYSYIQEYAYKNGIRPTAKLFDISVRAVQKQLKIVCDYLKTKGVDTSGVGTHSFRKYFATNIYVNNNYNIELVRKILQHSSISITQTYIGIQQKDVEAALQNNIRLV